MARMKFMNTEIDNLTMQETLQAIDQLIQENKAEVAVLKTHDTWFGVTYQEDKASVTEAFRKLIADGVYSEKLYD